MPIPLITDNHAEITALCERYGVVRLELFGSAAKGTFDPEASDLAFDYGPAIASLMDMTREKTRSSGTGTRRYRDAS